MEDITKETSNITTLSPSLSTDHHAQCQGGVDESGVNGSKSEADTSVVKLSNSAKGMELVSESKTGVNNNNNINNNNSNNNGVLQTDQHPHDNSVLCGSETDNGKMQHVCMEMEAAATLEETPPSVVEDKSTQQQAKPNLGISGVKRKAETSERTTSKEDTPSKGKECQRKWHCSLCEISTTSEGTLNIHMQGKKHKAKEAKSKSNDIPTVTGMDLDPSDDSLQPNVGPTNGTKTTEGNQTLIAKKWHCSLCQVSANSEALLNAHFLGKKHKAKETKEAKLGLDQKTGKTDGSENVKNEAITKWYCSVCQVYAASENNLQEHLQGKKHKAKEGGTNPPELLETCKNEEEMKEIPSSLQGKKHEAKEGGTSPPELVETRKNEQEMKEIPSSLHNGGDKKLEMGSETGKYWHCKMCNEGTRNEASMNDHRKSDKHRKALRKNCGGVIVVSRVMVKEAVGEDGKVAQE